MRYRWQRDKKFQYFDDGRLLSAQIVECGKPAPDLFLYSAAEMYVALGSCVVIKDSFSGIEGVAAAGMTVLGLAGGGHIAAGHDGRMRGVGGHHVFGDMAALPKLLSRL